MSISECLTLYVSTLQTIVHPCIEAIDIRLLTVVNIVGHSVKI